jgi:hypothetical protein
MLDGVEEEEDPPPALRFRPPTLPVLRRFPPLRELIATVRAVQVFDVAAFFEFTFSNRLL